LSELIRLFAPPGRDTHDAPLQAADLRAADGSVRALVLGLARPADWQALAAVWQGVQTDLEWPAPAIAVAGDAGLQLWFSLATPCPSARAAALLDALRARYLATVRPERLRLWPAADTDSSAPVTPVPAPLPEGGRWSAFVAPDLAPMFADEPWLDLPPNPEGQADLLARLRSIAPAAVDRAWLTLRAAPALPHGADQGPPPAGNAHATGSDPRRFLLGVMNDETVDLALRIEAAKALLAARADGR
jgi:hypothetical protein